MFQVGGLVLVVEDSWGNGAAVGDKKQMAQFNTYSYWFKFVKYGPFTIPF